LWSSCSSRTWSSSGAAHNPMASEGWRQLAKGTCQGNCAATCCPHLQRQRLSTSAASGDSLGTAPATGDDEPSSCGALPILCAVHHPHQVGLTAAQVGQHTSQRPAQAVRTMRVIHLAIASKGACCPQLLCDAKVGFACCCLPLSGATALSALPAKLPTSLVLVWIPGDQL
jgi:hypothetical protein